MDPALPRRPDRPVQTPFTREFITSLAEVETADRAFVVDALAPKRDIGVMADYAIGGLAMSTAGIFNGDGQNVTANADSSLMGVARGSYRVIPYFVLWGRATRFTLEYVSRTAGDPGVTRDLGLAQVQVIV